MLQFGHNMNTSWILCKSSCMCLIINPSYHTCVSFVFISFPYNVTYPPWFVTSYICTSFTLSMWTYHWWFGFHLFWCLCGSEHIVAHDTLQDIIVTSISESGTHLQWKVSHLFPHHIQWQINSLITRNNIWTFVNIVITNLTCLDMVHLWVVHDNTCNANCRSRKYMIIFK
jgi:hypothetical protein